MARAAAARFFIFVRMVSPFIRPTFSPRNSENAVAFAKGGNATLKTTGPLMLVNKRLKCGFFRIHHSRRA